MQKLTITLFSDGRPGHEKQSRGVAEALQHYVDVQVASYAVERLHPLGQLFSHLRYLLRIEACPDRIACSDLIIGTGSQTHIPVLSAARRWGAKSVACMSPPSHLIKRFDLCLVPLHDDVQEGGNIFRTVGPPTVADYSGVHRSDHGLILIGGLDESSHVWNSRRLIDDIAKLLREDKQWTISTSPRTPAETEMLVQELAADRPAVSFQPFSATPPGWVEEQYRLHAFVWITADSVSMVYEALSAGCCVGIIPVQWKKSDNKFKRGLDYLADREMIVRLETYQPGRTRFCNQEPLNEADRCAKEILRRWWPTNIP